MTRSRGISGTGSPVNGVITAEAPAGPTPGGGLPEAAVGPGAMEAAHAGSQSATTAETLEHQEASMAPTLHVPPARGRREQSAARLVALDADRPHHGAPVPDPLRIVVAEGHGLVRAGLRALLERQEGMRVAAEAATGEDAVAATREVRPDVVLIDMDLPGGGGLATAQRILDDTEAPASHVVMLITSESDEAVFGALRAGATGLLPKDADPEDLVRAVRAVAAGDAPLAPSLARRLVADFLARPERLRSTSEQLDELTAREREVVGLVACGLSNEEIAEQLVVTRATAKTHVSRALCKLNARDRAQLVILAYEAGLVRPRPHWPESSGRPGISRPEATGSIRRADVRPIAA